MSTAARAEQPEGTAIRPAPAVRRRGRPRLDEPGGDSRARLLDAARRRFASDGFDRASLRSIAADAGVDASLVRHYFGDKSGLLIATMQLPVDPAEVLRTTIASGVDGLGVRLVTAFLHSWDGHREVFSGLIRSTVAGADAAPPALDVLRSVILAELAEVLTGPDGRLRAELVVAQIVGLAMLRYLLQVEPLASTPAEVVAGQYGPVLQSLITPEQPAPEAIGNPSPGPA